MVRHRIALAVLALATLGGDCSCKYDPALQRPCERSTPLVDGCGFVWECGREGRVTVACEPADGAPATCTCWVVGGRADTESTVRTFESELLCGLTGQNDADEASRIGIVETGCGYSLRPQLRELLPDAGDR